MGIMDEWADALVEEGLREAAGTFFGARKALDDEITIFEKRVQDLSRSAGEVRAWFAGLNCLLGTAENSHSFFDALDVDLEDESLYTTQICSLQFKRPHSFTRKSLFAKTVLEVYEPLVRMIETYMHGAHYPDPVQPGRMLVSLHYEQVRAHCAAINARIVRINETNRPSESLGFVKRMDQGMLQKESLTGGGGQVWTLDSQMAFKPLDFAAYALPIFPDLPSTEKAAKQIKDVCAGIYEQQRLHVDAVFDEIFSPDNKKICLIHRVAGDSKTC